MTGLDPQSLGPYEIAAADLGISQGDASALQRVAAAQLGFEAVPGPSSLALMVAGLALAGATARRRRR